MRNINKIFVQKKLFQITIYRLFIIIIIYFVVSASASYFHSPGIAVAARCRCVATFSIFIVKFILFRLLRNASKHTHVHDANAQHTHTAQHNYVRQSNRIVFGIFLIMKQFTLVTLIRQCVLQ